MRFHHVGQEHNCGKNDNSHALASSSSEGRNYSFCLGGSNNTSYSDFGFASAFWVGVGIGWGVTGRAVREPTNRQSKPVLISNHLLR